jgi:NAD(P)H dehydrogenase (quinone)
VAFHVPYLSQETRQQILLDYRDHLSNLDRLPAPGSRLPALAFPSLDDFDAMRSRFRATRLSKLLK